MISSTADSVFVPKSAGAAAVGCGTLFGLFFAVVGLFWAVGMWNQESARNERHHLLETQGAPVQGVISEFTQWSASRGSPAHDNVTYQFALPDGRLYARSISVPPGEFTKNATADIRYLPSDPMISELVGYEKTGQPYFAVIGLVFAGVGAAMMISVLRKSPANFRPIAITVIAVGATAAAAAGRGLQSLGNAPTYTLQTAYGKALVGMSISQDKRRPQGGGSGSALAGPSLNAGSDDSVSLDAGGLTINGVLKQAGLKNHSHVRMFADGSYKVTEPLP